MTAPDANRRRVLVVGRHPDILARVTTLLASAGYETSGALSDDDAQRLIDTGPDALLIGGGVELDSRTSIIAAFAAAWPGRPVIEHRGGPHGLLEHLAERLGAP